MKKILIMGGTIFVSKYLATYFIAKGDDIYVYNRNTHKQPEKAMLIVGDRNNIGDSLKQYDFDLVIAVYPETLPQPFKEEQLVGDNSIWGDYGSNKIEAEQVLLSKVPNVYIIRPPYLYGKMQNLYREAFVFDCAEMNKPFYIPNNGDMKLQFFDVEDLCRFIEILIDKKPEDRIFNVGNEKIDTINTFVETCYKVVGSELEKKYVDESYNQRDYFPFHNYSYCLDVSKQKELMPTTKSLYQGLKESYEWYKNHRNDVNRKDYISFIENELKDI